MSREAPSGLILASGKAGLLIIAANCDDHELGFPTGFLKSRVYAKLLTRLISKRYQTFNGQVEEVGPDAVR
jgi:hypothetical protein